MRRLAIILFLVSSLGACEKWPPYEKELQQKFADNREELEALEEKIADTKYFRVSQTGILGIPRFKDSSDVVAEYEGDEHPESDFIKDDPEWEQHFRRAGIFSVSKYEGRTTFGFVGGLPDKSRHVWVEIVHSAEQRKDLKLCMPEHKELGCGLCVVDLDTEWFLEYWWTPEDIIPDRDDDWESGILSDDDYWKEFDEALQHCRASGYKTIGYDVSEWK